MNASSGFFPPSLPSKQKEKKESEHKRHPCAVEMSFTSDRQTKDLGLDGAVIVEFAGITYSSQLTIRIFLASGSPGEFNGKWRDLKDGLLYLIDKIEVRCQENEDS